MSAPRKRVSRALAASPAAAAIGQALGMRQPTEAELGLLDVPAHPGSPYYVLTVKGGGLPTTAQRVLMAQRAQQHNGAGAYARRRVAQEQQGNHEEAVQPQPEGEAKMTSKTTTGALPAGIDPKEIQRAFTKSNEETAEREAASKKEEAKKAKAEEQQRKAQAAARKRAKAEGVSPAKHASAKPEAAPAKSKGKEQPAAAPSKGGRPAKADDPNARYVVAKDNTRSGHMKVFMAGAAQLKKFTRLELVNATKAKVTVDRAERYFDYCLYKRLIKPA